MTTAALYLRVSTDRQLEGTSIDTQRAECMAYAQRQGWTVPPDLVFQDDESSFRPRQAYQAMLEAAVSGQFEALVIYDYYRFGRNFETSPADAARLERMGVTVVAVTQPHAGRFERNLHFLLGDKYSEDLSGRVRPAMVRRVMDGYWVGTPPVGYDLAPAPGHEGEKRPPRILVPDTEMAPKVRRLFELYATGDYSLYGLLREADTMGLKSHPRRIRGRLQQGNLSKANLAKVLRNTVYIGQVVYGRRGTGRFVPQGKRPEESWTVAEGRHAAIVDRETFERVQAVLARNRAFPGRLSPDSYLLTGLLVCGDCGRRMVITTQKRQRNGKPTSWVIARCARSYSYRDCPHTGQHGVKGIERMVLDQVRTIPLGPDLRRRVQALSRAQVREADHQEERDRAADDLRRREDDLKALAWQRVRNELPDYLWEAMRGDALEEIQRLRGLLKGLEAVALRGSQMEALLGLLEGIAWDTLTPQEWRVLLPGLVQRVTVYGRQDYAVTWAEGVEALMGLGVS